MQGAIFSGDRLRTQRELFERGARLARGLRALGVGAEDVVVLCLRNDFAFLECTLATKMLGAYAAPLNWHALGGEAAAVMDYAAPRAIVVHADLLEGIAAAVPAGVPVLVVPTPPEVAVAYGLARGRCRVSNGALDYEMELLRHEPLEPALGPAQVNVLNTIMFSGGTTGRPKAIRRLPMTPEKLEANAAASAALIPPGANFLITGPLYHNAPNSVVHTALRCSARIVLQPRFDAEEMLALVERHRITHLHVVPTMFVRLLRLPEAVRTRYDLSSLQLVLHGAAPCAREVKQAMIDWWGPVLVEYYGSTETGAVTAVTSEEWLARPGTVGKAAADARLVVLDEQGRPQPPGEPGEIFMWRDSQPDFTYHGQDALRQEIERDGLVTCGDIGYLDEDGYLFLCGRKKDLVISGGVNIYPAEIEAALIGFPGVRDCAVFGIPDWEFGEALIALVEPEADACPEPAAVRAYLRSRLAAYKVPKVVEIRSPLPREDSGKIFKRKLRAPYWGEAGRSS